MEILERVITKDQVAVRCSCGEELILPRVIIEANGKIREGVSCEGVYISPNRWPYCKLECYSNFCDD